MNASKAATCTCVSVSRCECRFSHESTLSENYLVLGDCDLRVDLYFFDF